MWVNWVGISLMQQTPPDASSWFSNLGNLPLQASDWTHSCLPSRMIFGNLQHNKMLMCCGCKRSGWDSQCPPHNSVQWSLSSRSLALLLIHFTGVKTPHERELTRSNRWSTPPTHTSTHTYTHMVQHPESLSFRSLSSMQTYIWFQIYSMLKY